MLHPQPDGYFAIPSSGQGRAVLVLHAWWGLNDTIKTFCDRLAEAGFIAFAPDLYHGQVTESLAEAETLVQALNSNHVQAEAEIAEAAGFLAARVEGDSLAVIGFSLGAFYALSLAETDPERIRSVVLFYGTGGGDFSHSRADYLGHFGEEDDYEPQADVDNLQEALRRAGRAVEFHRYPGAGHWFFEPDRLENFNSAAASLAWDRTLNFLRNE